jgi:hypothetical protein
MRHSFGVGQFAPIDVAFACLIGSAALACLIGSAALACLIGSAEEGPRQPTIGEEQ